ncbi:hypothetical protein TNIN_127031 [Trichonephila inaurata madagascariensis]|uniref:Uncharacterized protein n=1 Tax=Trichonephila inaurata madagascariensis TaxID=2747483 RepID=A0A8X7BRU0_9ARAC|nr:hypothetical protein TNIN_127031 [Trichonephila inaurata madagascariensis]
MTAKIAKLSFILMINILIGVAAVFMEVGVFVIQVKSQTSKQVAKEIPVENYAGYGSVRKITNSDARKRSQPRSRIMGSNPDFIKDPLCVNFLANTTHLTKLWFCVAAEVTPSNSM